MSPKSLGLVAFAALSAAGCGKFNLDLVEYNVNPSPLEYHNDSVEVTITASYPEKVVPKKAEVTLTPVIKYKGGEVALKATNYRGEKSTGSGEILSHSGGSIKGYNDLVVFVNGMEEAELHIRAVGSVKGKEKFNETTSQPIALGTIMTPTLVMGDERFDYSEHNYGPIYKNSTVHVYFPYNSASIRPGERRSDEMENFQSFAEAQKADGGTFEKVEVNGWASPDGEEANNQGLSSDRAAAVKDMIESYFTRKLDIATIQYTVNGQGEDKSGFSRLLNESQVGDKAQVSSQINAGVFNAELKSLGRETYATLEKEVLTPLRRAEVVLTVKERQKTNEELVAYASADSALSLEEFLYTAETLIKDDANKLQVLDFAARRYPEDHRAYNNRGVILARQGKIQEAKTEFEKAEKVNGSASDVQTNLGACYMKLGNRDKALAHYKKAQGGSQENNHNLGSLYIRMAKYTEAVSLFGDECSFNAALAKVLAGSPEKAGPTLDCGDHKELALSYYLKAVAAARTNSQQAVYDNLGKAIGKDASLKEKAKKDLEFLKMRSNSEFQSLIN